MPGSRQECWQKGRNVRRGAPTWYVRRPPSRIHNYAFAGLAGPDEPGLSGVFLFTSPPLSEVAAFLGYPSSLPLASSSLLHGNHPKNKQNSVEIDPSRLLDIHWSSVQWGRDSSRDVSKDGLGGSIALYCIALHCIGLKCGQKEKDWIAHCVCTKTLVEACRRERLSHDNWLLASSPACPASQPAPTPSFVLSCFATANPLLECVG